MAIDFTKPVQTRDGKSIRILATDFKGPHPVIGIGEFDGVEVLVTYTATGGFLADKERAGIEDPNDLVNVPEPPKARSFPVYCACTETGTVLATTDAYEASMFAVTHGSKVIARKNVTVDIDSEDTETTNTARVEISSALIRCTPTKE